MATETQPMSEDSSVFTGFRTPSQLESSNPSTPGRSTQTTSITLIKNNLPQVERDLEKGSPEKGDPLDSDDAASCKADPGLVRKSFPSYYTLY